MAAVLTEAFRTRTTDEWLSALQAADILCARVSSYDDVMRHPQVAANGMLAEVVHPPHGTIRMPGFPVDSVAANALAHRPAPRCGEHTRQVLHEYGFDDGEIAELQRSGAICRATMSERHPGRQAVA
jgi:crotonobetainyl-CoA:carnitine CoA-transferase CaiB-like acyl-CoA transferase